jgi:hypothetical protein
VSCRSDQAAPAVTTAIVPGVVPLTTRRPVLCALVAGAALIAVIVPIAVVTAGAA